MACHRRDAHVTEQVPPSVAGIAALLKTSGSCQIRSWTVEGPRRQLEALSVLTVRGLCLE
jgi:hypothetical protein